MFVLPSLQLLFQGNESIVAKTTVTVPNDGGPIEATSTIETVPCWTRSRGKTGPLGLWLSCLCKQLVKFGTIGFSEPSRGRVWMFWVVFSLLLTEGQSPASGPTHLGHQAGLCRGARRVPLPAASLCAQPFLFTSGYGYRLVLIYQLY